MNAISKELSVLFYRATTTCSKHVEKVWFKYFRTLVFTSNLEDMKTETMNRSVIAIILIIVIA